MKKGLKYVGNGLIWVINNVPVPNRDLTADEVELNGGEEHLLSSGLYERHPAPPKKKDGSEVTDDGS